jgi:S1/P1 Nuclease
MLPFCCPSNLCRRNTAGSLLVLCVAASACPAFAWNGLGHKVVAEIAWQQLDAPTRQQIVDTLRRHPRFAEDFEKKMPEDVATSDKATQDHWIFQQAATWPDMARKTQYDQPSWHYINVPLFLDGERPVPFNLSTDYPTTTMQAEGNVVQATKHCLALIANRDATVDTKALAYAWLIHLVGDMHQPLHSTALVCDYFPQGDEGGNKIPVVQGHNLHSLWDGLLGTRSRMQDVDREVAKMREQQELWDVDTKLDINGWIAESHAAAVSVVYDPAILQAVREATPGVKLEPITLTEDYLRAAGQLARRRIVAAGVRLGTLLKQPAAD